MQLDGSPRRTTTRAATCRGLARAGKQQNRKMFKVLTKKTASAQRARHMASGKHGVPQVPSLTSLSPSGQHLLKRSRGSSSSSLRSMGGYSRRIFQAGAGNAALQTKLQGIGPSKDPGSEQHRQETDGAEVDVDVLESAESSIPRSLVRQAKRQEGVTKLTRRAGRLLLPLLHPSPAAVNGRAEYRPVASIIHDMPSLVGWLVGQGREEEAKGFVFDAAQCPAAACGG
ncbi:hypothetical protein CORC01_10942 [Colletotrichum orchidophilum]|uniref:Uncharacterized protein n=1 Tax=Colletotrichum orchidophilum TaxID=1209926 RepID=A0A1G4AX78_9PEZI|nr:uncharacterized protein CORC01_10942 [Colletotrichum orchidophilum]OHE93715.1 hypothetical protein CORC01_10942 [Colletotrichum orchidophilum]